MIVSREAFVFDGLPSDLIGIHSNESDVTIFFSGDETTPEWKYCHPPRDPIAEAKSAKRAEINDADQIAWQPVKNECFAAYDHHGPTPTSIAKFTTVMVSDPSVFPPR